MDSTGEKTLEHMWTSGIPQDWCDFYSWSRATPTGYLQKDTAFKDFEKIFPEFYIVLLKLSNKMYCLTLHDALTVQVTIFIIIIWFLSSSLNLNNFLSPWITTFIPQSFWVKVMKKNLRYFLKTVHHLLRVEQVDNF